MRTRHCRASGALLAAALLLYTLPLDAGMRLDSGPGQAMGLHWSSATVEARPGGDGWSLALDGLRWGEARPLGSFRLDCPSGRLLSEWPHCEHGRFAWRPVPDQTLSGRLDMHRDRDGQPAVELALDEPVVSARLVLAEGAPRISINADEIALQAFAGLAEEWLGLAWLDGALSLAVDVTGDEVRLRAEVSGLGFDNEAGELAGDAIALTVTASAHATDTGWALALEVAQPAGEWLFGTVYIPAPEVPVRLVAEGHWQPGQDLSLARWSFDDPAAVSASGELSLDLSGETPAIQSFRLSALEARLPAAQTRYLDGLLSGMALNDMQTAGSVHATGHLDSGGQVTLALDLSDVSVSDARQRFGVSGLDGQLAWDGEAHSLDARLSWSGAELYALPLGASRLHLETRAGDLLLVEPLVLPLLDGAFRVRHFEWRDWRGEAATLDVDAELEPVDFARFSLALGWPELGGRVSGNFPGVRYTDGVMRVAGGMEVAAFSGNILIEDLAIERPFGTLPVLSADITFDELDLLEVTGAFGFGRMEGRLGGYVRRVRMLDWQPVAFDARLATVDPGGRRQRISQRAVDNLSSLGGGSALTTPFLRFFEDFGYRRVGLTCHLANNVCRMGGVADTDDGGFIIVQGRGLPRLNIIGFRRLVDWPQLVRQLQAVTEAEVR